MMPQQAPMSQPGFMPTSNAPPPNGMIPVQNGMVNGMVPMGPGLSSSPLLNNMNKFNGPQQQQPAGKARNDVQCGCSLRRL